MRLCRDCDFVFAWPVEHIDPVDIYSRAYRGGETRTEMDDYATRLGRRGIVVRNETIGLWSPAHHEALRWLEANVPKGSTVLEVGCGLGSFMRALRRRGYNAVGVDVAEPVVEAVKHEGFQAWCGTVDSIPDGWVQPQPAAIVSFFLLHHLTDPIAFLRAIRSRWSAPLIMGYNRAPTKRTARVNNFPPRTWGWWSERAIARALKRAGYAAVEITKEPKGTPQLFLPPRLHRSISALLWRWPRLRVLARPIVDTVLALGFRLLRPVPSLRRSFEGSLFIIASPASGELARSSWLRQSRAEAAHGTSEVTHGAEPVTGRKRTA